MMHDIDYIWVVEAVTSDAILPMLRFRLSLAGLIPEDVIHGTYPTRKEARLAAKKMFNSNSYNHPEWGWVTVRYRVAKYIRAAQRL